MLRGLIKYWVYLEDCQPGMTIEVESAGNHANQATIKGNDNMEHDKAKSSSQKTETTATWLYNGFKGFMGSMWGRPYEMEIQDQ